MALLVAGIILGFGVPNLMEFQRNSAMSAAANDLVTALLVARTEAVKRQAPVTLCLTDNPTATTPTCAPGSVFDSATRGYVVWVDENNNFDADGARVLTDVTDGNRVIDAGELVLSQIAAPGATTRVHVTASCGHLTFAPTGFLLPPVPPCGTSLVRAVIFCDDRGQRVAAGSLASTRAVRMRATGRPEVLQELSVITPLIPPAANCPVIP